MQKIQNVFIAPKDTIPETTLKFFTRAFFHYFISFFLIGSVIAQIYLFLTNEKAKKRADYPIYVLTLKYDTLMEEETYVTTKIFYANYFIMSIIYLIPATVIQLWYGYTSAKYSVNLAPKYKFQEFGVITTLMFVQIVVLCGIRDILTILTVCALMASSMLFGYIQDRLSGVNIIHWDLSPHEWGYLAYITLWGTAFAQLFRSVNSENYVLPSTTLITVFGAFFGHTLFAVVQYYFVVIPAKLGYERIDDDSIQEMDGAVQILGLLTKLWQVWLPVFTLIQE